MKASRIVAVGLVVGAVAWVASGHLVPHESAESRAAIRADTAAAKPFRVAVAETKLSPHARKLTLSGRTEADKKVTITARTGGSSPNCASARAACEEGRDHRGPVR
jgi:membrane fusion protein, multidrug efflux system